MTLLEKGPLLKPSNLHGKVKVSEVGRVHKYFGPFLRFLQVSDYNGVKSQFL